MFRFRLWWNKFRFRFRRCPSGRNGIEECSEECLCSKHTVVVLTYKNQFNSVLIINQKSILSCV